VDDVRRLPLDFDHADLLREPAVHDLVAELLIGERPW
jgi:hypothetical protein